MAVSKSIPSSPTATRQHIAELFKKSHVVAERRHAWKSATAHLDNGDLTLRFPLYEHLHNFNLCAQRMIDLLRLIDAALNEPMEEAFYYECLIQKVRSAFTSAILDQMADVEHLEGWIFESLCRTEEIELTNPEDIYLKVRDLETERVNSGQEPRIRFLDDLESAAESDPDAAD